MPMDDFFIDDTVKKFAKYIYYGNVNEAARIINDLKANTQFERGVLLAMQGCVEAIRKKEERSLLMKVIGKKLSVDKAIQLLNYNSRFHDDVDRGYFTALKTILLEIQQQMALSQKSTS